ncbi:MAG: polysaccharide deacetylase family protein [Elusimicrobia bacterium]|nr:polysaccharide deacetylase family protein [Elusimicrobiota bacterium]
MNILTAAAGLGALGVSLRWNWWRPAKKGIPVLMYHRMGVPPEESAQKSLWIGADRFRWHLDYLEKAGYQPVTFEDISRGNEPRKPVIITFDDGYLNQYEIGFKILKERGLHGVFYIVTESMGKENFWHDPKAEPRLKMMSESHVKEIAAAGMEIGSHALTHRRFLTFSADEAGREFELSKKKLDELLGKKIFSFAFPYGNGENDPGLIAAAKRAGYQWIAGIHAGIWNKNGQAAIPRIYVRGDDWKIDFPLQLTRGRSRL